MLMLGPIFIGWEMLGRDDRKKEGQNQSFESYSFSTN